MLVQHKMKWTAAYFCKQESLWMIRANFLEASARLAAYACHQAAQWRQHISDADAAFCRAYIDYIPLIT